jgi:hypothetical protein
MILREKCDSVNSNFTDEEIREVYVCAEQRDDGTVVLYEQYEGVEKEGPHSITRKVTVDKQFIELLSDKLNQ